MAWTQYGDEKLRIFERLVGQGSGMLKVGIVDGASVKSIHFIKDDSEPRDYTLCYFERDQPTDSLTPTRTYTDGLPPLSERVTLSSEYREAFSQLGEQVPDARESLVRCLAHFELAERQL